MGSKNRIADEVVAVLPKADTLYDVFAGGCAITHKAMLSGKYNRYFANDITDVPKLFNDAVCGKFSGENRWISRDDFLALKDSEPYVRVCWSFGNSGKNYLYSKTIEPYKRACHYAVVFDDWEQLYALCPEVAEAAHDALKGITDRKKRRLAFGVSIVKRLKEIGDWDLVTSNPLYKSCHWRGGKLDGRNNDLQSLQSLESLERLESLESLQKLQSLEITQTDYRHLTFRTNSVIYCDIPYKGSTQYSKDGFDHDAFYSWALAQTQPIFISEYDMPSEFECIKEIKHRSVLSAIANNAVVERIFVPKKQPKYYIAITQPKLFEI